MTHSLSIVLVDQNDQIKKAVEKLSHFRQNISVVHVPSETGGTILSLASTEENLIGVYLYCLGKEVNQQLSKKVGL